MGITSFGDQLFFTISQNTNLLWNIELSFIRIRCPFLNYEINEPSINDWNYNNYNTNSTINPRGKQISFEPSIQEINITI